MSYSTTNVPGGYELPIHSPGDEKRNANIHFAMMMDSNVVRFLKYMLVLHIAMMSY